MFKIDSKQGKLFIHYFQTVWTYSPTIYFWKITPLPFYLLQSGFLEGGVHDVPIYTNEYMLYILYANEQSSKLDTCWLVSKQYLSVYYTKHCD